MKSKRYHLKLDMDDTLVSLVGPSIELAKKVLNRNLTRPGPGAYRGWFPGQLNADERQELLRHVYTDEFYTNLPSAFSAMHGMSMKRLSEYAHENFASVGIITARSGVFGSDERAERVTRACLKLHDFQHLDSVEINCHHHDVPKTDFCVDGPTIMVDDSTSVADHFAETAEEFDHRFVMIDQSWNVGYRGGSWLVRTQSRNLLSALERVVQ